MTAWIEVDDTLCVGAGNCEAVAPDNFRLDDDGISRVVNDNPSDGARIERAIAECPVMAIHRRGQ